MKTLKPNKLENKKRKALTGMLTRVKRVVKQLQSYFYQGGKWRKVKFVKGV